MSAKTREIAIGNNVNLGGDNGLVLIAGPCVIESEDHVRHMAESLCKLTQKLGMQYIFKASYDKGNRSSIGGFRGPGIENGLKTLDSIRKEFGVPVLSDIHSAAEVGPSAEVLDIIQIPAFLCRQTEILLEAGNSGKPVNVKKGQFMAPWDMKNVIAKIESTGNANIAITERGASFGYNHLVSDMRALPIMRGM
ncbi:MAG: 3-deoxy-8-phosphooctulonate synthase, partial [Planctomycetes bacterium]|nr:3-deoxy-8-phosphooctulonate synthase [Planctomycetota bacterium]